LVFLETEPDEVADFVRRILRHPELKTWAQRSGAVIRVLPTALLLWRIRAKDETLLSW
jgi:hypothetical protein